MTLPSVSAKVRLVDSLTRLGQSRIAGPGLASGMTIIASVLLSFGGQMLIARHLGVGSYGQYAILLSWAMLLVLPASLGIDGAIMRYMPGYLVRGETRRFRWLIAVCALAQVASVLTVIAALALFNGLGADIVSWASGYSLIMVGILIGATVLGNTGAAVLQAARRVVVAQLYNNVLRPLLVLLLVAAMLYGVGGGYSAIGIFSVTAASAVVTTVFVAVYIAAKYLFVASQGPNDLPVRQWFSYSIANLLGGVGQQALIQLPLLLVGNYAGTIEASHYGVASRLAATVLLGLAALASVSMPLLAAAFDAKDNAEIQKIVTFGARLACGFGLLVATAFALVGVQVLDLFGPGFRDAYPVLLVLVIGLALSSALGPAVGVVAISGRPSVVAGANVIGVLLVVAIAAMVVPQHGAMGGAAAFVVGNFVAVLISTVYARVKLGQDTTIIGKSVWGRAPTVDP